MKRHCKAGFWLRAADNDLFHYLHQAKVATALQINRDIYHYEKINTLYHRLALLQRLGLIASTSHQALPKVKVFHLSEKGFRDFVADGTERVIELKSQAILHDLALVDVRHCLLKSRNVTRFLTENELRAWNDHWRSEILSCFIDVRCDGVAFTQLTGGDVTFAVEYEASCKSQARVDEIVAKYYRNGDIPGVLLICEGDAVKQLYVSSETKFLKDRGGDMSNKFFYVNLQNMLVDPDLIFTDLEGNRLRLGGSLSNKAS